MTDWRRDNSWRQGCVLTKEAADKIGLIEAQPGSTIFVVVSHDCDIAQLPESEPYIEVVSVNPIDSPDGNCTHAKNPRKLHLPFSIIREQVWVEIIASNKIQLPKAALANLKPNPDFSITWEHLSILQRWLATRYRRAAFPDAFESRLRDTGIKDRLTKILAPLGEHIHAVFFDVDNGEAVVREAPEDTYALAIYLLFNTNVDPLVAEEEVAKASAKITGLFQSKCFVKGEWKFIELVCCDPISDEALTFRQSVLLKKWNLDHYSLRDTSQPEPTE